MSAEDNIQPIVDLAEGSKIFQEAMQRLPLIEGKLENTAGFTDAVTNQVLRLGGRYLIEQPQEGQMYKPKSADMPMLVRPQTIISTRRLQYQINNTPIALDKIAEAVLDTDPIALLRKYKYGGLPSISAVAFVPLVGSKPALGYFDLVFPNGRYAVLMANNTLLMESLLIVEAGQNPLMHIAKEAQEYLQFTGINDIPDKDLFDMPSKRGEIDFIMLPLQHQSFFGINRIIQPSMIDPHHHRDLSSSRSMGLNLQETVASSSGIKSSILQKTTVQNDATLTPAHFHIKVIGVNVGENGKVDFPHTSFLTE